MLQRGKSNLEQSAVATTNFSVSPWLLLPSGGDLALRSFAITQLAWIGVISIFIALLIVAINLRPSKERAQAK
jgi:hypothetical protein